MDLLLPLLLVALLIPMFLGVRRQKREMAKVTEMQETLKVGDRVVTTSGLFGTVVEADDDSVDLEIAEDVVTTWLRASIREIRNEDATAVEESTDTEAPIAESGSDSVTASENSDGAEGSENSDAAPKLSKD
ncbi:preprotein translocase subunit YajC [Nocardia sp. NBC_01503]|uniref:preprotein translocase subunit YajC n=1 Tax=Nocardia sp. NBC_01503 TaxID=2975997 RepID=UPI002E7C2559|nr:preprotein translocase subunit YajC [Nocardia sp. NBC_01503]WTL30319.1 preprotein translocase subunit YajC [Nocardia sp. NBC_01503]